MTLKKRFLPEGFELVSQKNVRFFLLYTPWDRERIHVERNEVSRTGTREARRKYKEMTTKKKVDFVSKQGKKLSGNGGGGGWWHDEKNRYQNIFRFLDWLPSPIRDLDDFEWMNVLWVFFFINTYFYSGLKTIQKKKN